MVKKRASKYAKTLCFNFATLELQLIYYHLVDGIKRVEVMLSPSDARIAPDVLQKIKQ